MQLVENAARAAILLMVCMATPATAQFKTQTVAPQLLSRSAGDGVLRGVELIVGA